MSLLYTVQWGLLVLVVCTSWACSGTYGAFHPPLWGLFAVLAVLVGVAVARAEATVRRSFLTDPILVCGILLSLLLLVQWLNAGGELIESLFTGEISYTPPPHEGWPFSVEARLSRQQLLWFVPPVLFLPVVRHLLTRRQAKQVMTVLLINAAILAAFGLVQLSTGTRKMFWTLTVPGNNPYPVATFDYANHAGVFFYLLFAVGVGMFLDAGEKRKPLTARAIPGGLALLFAFIVFLTQSRAAVLAVMAVLFFGLAAWIWRVVKKVSVGHSPMAVPAVLVTSFFNRLAGGWNSLKRVSLSAWVNTVLFIGLICIMLALGFIGVGTRSVLKEMQSRRLVVSDLLGYQDGRGFQMGPAVEMIKDHPWFGVGGWGYSKFVLTELPRDQWERLNIGKANVHCDPVQFLVEHGIIGFGLMTIALVALLRPWGAFRTWPFKGLPFIIACGCGIVFLHSLIDLPFRNPAVLWHWLLLLALVPIRAQTKQAPEVGIERQEIPGSRVESLCVSE